MKRREFLHAIAGAEFALSAHSHAASPGARIITVNGPIPAAELGIALTHEHVLVDSVGAAEAGLHRHDIERVCAAALPHLQQAFALGVRSIFESSTQFLGRDARVLRRLSAATKLHLVTNTGLYGWRQGKYLIDRLLRENPAQAFSIAPRLL